MTIDDLVKHAVKMKEAKDEIAQAMEIINDELRDRLIKMKVTGMRVNGNYVSQVKRISTTDVTMEQARELGATKTDIDAQKLRKLYQSGVKIKGIKVSVSVRITEAKDEK